MDLETLPQLRSLNLSGTLVKLEMLPVKHLQNLSEMDLSNQKFRGSHLNLRTVCCLPQKLPILKALVFRKNAINAGSIKRLANCYQALIPWSGPKQWSGSPQWQWVWSYTQPPKAESKQVSTFLCQQQDLECPRELGTWASRPETQ